MERVETAPWETVSVETKLRPLVVDEHDFQTRLFLRLCLPLGL